MSLHVDIDGLRRHTAATLHEVCPTSRVLPRRIRPLWPGARVLGPAFPVNQPAGSNERLHRAIYRAPPGSVLVATTADEAYGYWGELMSRAAKARRLAGLVILGGVRDVEVVEEIAFPVFASTVCMRGTRKLLLVPDTPAPSVSVEGIEVRAGDVVVGDRDGVVALPSGEACGAGSRADAREARESTIRASLARGARLLDLVLHDADPEDEGGRV